MHDVVIFKITDPSRISAFNLTEGTPQWEIKEASGFGSCGISDDGQNFLVCDDENFLVVDGKNGDFLKLLMFEEQLLGGIADICFTPTQNTLAVLGTPCPMIFQLRCCLSWWRHL